MKHFPLSFLYFSSTICAPHLGHCSSRHGTSARWDIFSPHLAQMQYPRAPILGLCCDSIVDSFSCIETGPAWTYFPPPRTGCGVTTFCGLATFLMNAATGTNRLNVHTMAAPVGKSMLAERYNPMRLARIPTDHPNAKRILMLPESSIAHTAGAIR